MNKKYIPLCAIIFLFAGPLGVNAQSQPSLPVASAIGDGIGSIFSGVGNIFRNIGISTGNTVYDITHPITYCLTPAGKRIPCMVQTPYVAPVVVPAPGR